MLWLWTGPRIQLPSDGNAPSVGNTLEYQGPIFKLLFSVAEILKYLLVKLLVLNSLQFSEDFVSIR